MLPVLSRLSAQSDLTMPGLSKVYDALIIGGGPSGLSVALGLGRVHRTCALFSDETFRNEGIHAMHAIVTRDGEHPATFRRIAREQIKPYGNTDFFDKTRIVRVEKKKVADDKDGFEVARTTTSPGERVQRSFP